MIRAASMAAEDYRALLAEELARRGVTIEMWHGRLARSPDQPPHAAWTLDTWPLDTWTAPQEIAVPSVCAVAVLPTVMEFADGHVIILFNNRMRKPPRPWSCSRRMRTGMDLGYRHVATRHAQ